jgi:hypothetical protein
MFFLPISPTHNTNWKHSELENNWKHILYYALLCIPRKKNMQRSTMKKKIQRKENYSKKFLINSLKTSSLSIVYFFAFAVPKSFRKS